MARQILSLIFILVLFSACHKSKKPERFEKIEKVAWILGSWENQTPKGISLEYWTKSNDSCFTGQSYFIRGNDTLFSEKLQLTEQNDTLMYIPVVLDQNENKPVCFINSFLSDSLLVFKNVQHDFPQIISYRKVKHDSIVATISGLENGNQKKIDFPMKRRYIH